MKRHDNGPETDRSLDAGDCAEPDRPLHGGDSDRERVISPLKVKRPRSGVGFIVDPGGPHEAAFSHYRDAEEYQLQFMRAAVLADYDDVPTTRRVAQRLAPQPASVPSPAEPAAHRGFLAMISGGRR
jgi:hypothetical protein